MRNIRKHLRYISLSAVFLFLGATPVFADANDFSFKSFEADYYLTKDINGISHLHVEENLVAIFPEIDQNHGITRDIPRTNAAGANSTIANTEELNLIATLGSAPVDFSIFEYPNFFSIRLGSAYSYVHGEQTYHLSYDFSRVILGYDPSGQVIFPSSSSNISNDSNSGSESNTSGIANSEFQQELYWDTNGVNWGQSFDSLVARVHIPTDILSHVQGDVSCYVGKAGSSDTSRCRIVQTADGYEFSTDYLGAGENLTFDIVFEPGTFTIQRLDPYSTESTSEFIAAIATVCFWSFWVSMILIGLFVIYKNLVLPITDFIKLSPKRNFLRTTFTPPNFLPPAGLGIAEAAQLIIPRAKAPEVASLIQLAVTKQVSLVRSERKSLHGYHWNIVVNNLDDVDNCDYKVLMMLNGGKTVSDGDTIEIRKRGYISKVSSLRNDYQSSARNSLRQKGFLEYNSARTDFPKIRRFSKFIILLVVISAMGYLLEPIFVDMLVLAVGILACVFIISKVVGCIIEHSNQKYSDKTEKGLAVSVYLNGLKLYMEMSEAKRLQFLQSVDGADVSPTGIVKLYEKLLPYAVLFGVEESWKNELQHYLESTPDYDSALVALDIAYISSSVETSIRDASTVHSYSSSSYSGSSSSSSYSGSSGGGSSGGGGGGGGGGGW